MSMSKEQVAALLEEKAVVCCRTEKGTVISEKNLEDPSIFPDMIDGGLLKLTDDCLKIKNVIGAKLIKTIDSLTPLTRDLLENINEDESFNKSSHIDDIDKKEKAVLKIGKKSGEIIELCDLENPMYFSQLSDSLLINLDENVLTIEDVLGKKLRENVKALTPIVAKHLEGYKENKILNNSNMDSNSILKIKIAEGKGIDIEIPLNISSTCSNIDYENMYIEKDENLLDNNNKIEESNLKPKKVRGLTKKHFNIDNIEFADETKIEANTLYIRRDICKDAIKESELVKDLKLDIITEKDYNKYSETIMDVQPIATKEGESKIGSGVTRVLDGVIVMVTGTDEDGVQIGEFGSSEGILEENIMWNRPGAPDKGEIFIKTEVTIARGTNMERPGPLAAHKATDFITQEIRMALKKLDESLMTNKEELVQYRRPGRKKVVIVKEIMGQGAMHDNLILPQEPVGVLGGKPNVDLGNIPVMLSPIEVLDGGIHALTCIGPASKECSRHYFREPLVIEAMKESEIDLAGVIFIGSPQINSEKFYVSERLGMMIEAMDIDGAIVTTEGFGNNHIDFASHIEQIGMRGIPCVGMSFCAVQGALVVGNKYMKYMVDNNKSEAGIENEVLSCNTLCKEDAIRALEMLKSAMNGEKVKEAERKWSPNIKENNLKEIEKANNTEIKRVENETSIPVSKKRLEKYATK